MAEQRSTLEERISAFHAERRARLEERSTVTEREIVVHDRRGRPIRVVVPVKCYPRVETAVENGGLIGPASFNKGRKSL